MAAGAYRMAWNTKGDDEWRSKKTSILELTCEKSSRVLRRGGGTRSRETTRTLLSLPGFLVDLRGGVGVVWSFPVAMLID